MTSTQLPKPIVVTSWLATVILTVVGFTCGAQRLLIAQQPAPGTAAGTSSANLNPTAAANASPVDPNLEALMQGAVHEAFGQPVLFNPIPNPVISQQPPAPIEEMPPSMKPVGNNVQWIPGYWSWEAIQQKFVWTSGIWRVLPPGLTWLPGYWMQSGTGFQWVSGFWNRSGTATALASFSQQMSPNGLVSASASTTAALVNQATASALAPTSNPTVPSGASPIANPTNAAGADPSLVFPPPATSPASPAGATGAPAAAGAPIATAADPTMLGAVPGPNPSTPNPLPGTTLPGTTLPGTTLPGTTVAPTLTAAAPIPTVTIPANPAALGTNPVGVPIPTAATIANPANAAIASAAPIDLTATSATADPFVPQPPASLESGPVGDPPTSDCTWIPGTWIYRHGRFLWLAGQWSPIHRGWVWVPARYVWTPAGYVFVDGYWDYELAQRGVLFAPVSFRRGFHGWGFTYTPSVVLNTDLLTDYLFVNGPCGCYCFGDYFGADCARTVNESGCPQAQRVDDQPDNHIVAPVARSASLFDAVVTVGHISMTRDDRLATSVRAPVTRARSFTLSLDGFRVDLTVSH